MNEVTMKISKSGFKRFMALFLSLCLCLTMIQTNVWADDANTSSKVKDLTLLAGGETIGSDGLTLQTIGETKDITLTATFQSEGEGTLGDGNFRVHWASVDESIVSVAPKNEGSPNATVEAVGVGTTTITATVGEGDEAAAVACTVTVKGSATPENPGADITVTGITLYQGEKEISKNTVLTLQTSGEGATTQLTAKLQTAGNGTLSDEEAITWTVTPGEGIVELDVATGATVTITAKGIGTAYVTATYGTDAEPKTATCRVEVKGNTPSTPVEPGPAEVTGIKLYNNGKEISSSKLTLQTNGEATLTAELQTKGEGNLPETPVINWRSSDANVVEVSAATGNTVTVRAKGIAGTATITATVGEGDKVISANCTVEVVEGEVPETPDVPTDPGTSGNIKVTKIELSPESLALVEKETAELTATIQTAAEATPREATTGQGIEINWSVKGEAVTIEGSGNTITVKAVKEGTATITAKAGDQTATCEVTVSKKKDDTVTVAISLSATTLSIEAGKSAPLTVTKVEPADATVTWSSTNQATATIANGVVSAKAVGTTTITATATKNGKTATASCIVTVTPAKPIDVVPNSVKLDQSKATVAKEKSFTLKATVAPANANKDTKITWTTSDKTIATVDANGKVTGKKGGIATITATTANNKSATCTVTVAEVTLNAKETVIQVKKSSAAVKVATKFPKNDSVKSYKSANTKVATVDKKGKVTGKKVGKTTITVTMKSGATATFKVTIQKGKVVTKKLAFAEKTVNVVKGKKATLSVTRTPISATEKLTYTSSNKKVATVDKNGKVTGKAYGTAKITVKSKNGKKATCTVKVVPSVTLKTTKASIKVKGTTTIAVKSMIKGDKVKSYKSADTKIATVDKKGKVTGKKAGTTTITVTTNKGATAVFTVTVK